MKKILTLLAIGIVGFTSCKEEEITEESHLYLDQMTLIYDADGGKQGVYVTSSDTWQLSGNVDWCKPSATSGMNGDYVYFTVGASQDTDEKSAEYTFTCGTASQKLTVIQKQKDALTVTSSNFEIPADGQEITIEVKANIQFEYEITDGSGWIHEVGTKTMETTVLNFTVDANSEFEDREGRITITSGDISETITIHQAESVPAINIETKEYEVSAECEPITVEIEANVEYRYRTDADWIHFADISEDGIVLEIDRNNLLESRTAEVEFYNEEYNLSVIISVKQNAYGLDDMLKTVHVETKGTLSKVLAENGADAAEYLKITGVLNDVDFLVLNEMGTNNLIYLDISEVDMTVLPNDAMNGTNLSHIILPDELVEIGDRAFCGTNLLKVEIPESVEIIGEEAFQDCTSLTEINIPLHVRKIGYSAFYNCTSLQGSIVIPATLESWNYYTFTNTAIQSVTFAKRNTPIQIQRYSFKNCKNLTTVTFEQGCQISDINSRAFHNCTALSQITIPASVKLLDVCAFYECSSLESVIFENGSNLNTIGNGCFADCSVLKSITIPASVTEIESTAFADCSSLQEVNFESGSQLKRIGGGASYEYDSKTHTKEFLFSGAFRSCTSLTSITIPSGVTTIEPATFRSCISLSEIYFEKNSQLQSINASSYHEYSSTHTFGYPFEHCPLKVFDASNCSNLELLYNAPFECNEIALFKLGTSVPPELTGREEYWKVIGTTTNSILKVPDESVEAYKDSDWSRYFSTISGLSE